MSRVVVKDSPQLPESTNDIQPMLKSGIRMSTPAPDTVQYM